MITRWMCEMAYGWRWDLVMMRIVLSVCVLWCVSTGTQPTAVVSSES